ncbi:MAG: thioesterase family protein [Flavobacteriaceae bacterium]|nr:thioesterase family protein [Flavobacteriaceae bacterium]
MIELKHSLRVRYGETDPMKYAYYGNYAEYLEVARVELFRAIGISYSEIENRGIWLPVSEYKIKFFKPAKYDDLITIQTQILKKPTAKIEFEYTIYNQKNEKLTEASTTLFFLDAQTQKIIRCPEFLMDLIKKNWKEK